ncbi:MAG: 6,7-dimethyl-8-ribityllumazine synthase [Acidobacteriota bacterium]
MQNQAQAKIATPGNVRALEGSLAAQGVRVGIVVSRYHQDVTGRMLAAAVQALSENGGRPEDVEVLFVPGSFEIPLAVDRAAQTGRFDALVALGCLIQGETIHMRIIAREVARGILATMQASGIPVGFGLLTVNTHDQAMERSGGKAGNKGRDAALAAIEMVNLLNGLAAPVEA